MPDRFARTLDGSSLAGALAGSSASPGRVVPIEGRDRVGRSRHGYKALSYVGVRTARYSYVEYRRATFASRAEGIRARLGAGRTTEAELYDLARDPYELKNRAKTPRYRGIRTELSALTNQLDRCSGADCVTVAAIRR